MMVSEEERETTSIKVKPSLWKDFKIWCINNDVQISDKLEEILKGVVKK
jgi:hypothetical protein